MLKLENEANWRKLLQLLLVEECVVLSKSSFSANKATMQYLFAVEKKDFFSCKVVVAAAKNRAEPHRWVLFQALHHNKNGFHINL